MSLEEIQSSSDVDSPEPQNLDIDTETTSDSQDTKLEPEIKEETKNEKPVEAQSSNEIDIDEDLYKEVLEKLDIKAKTEDIQEQSMQEKNINEAHLNKIKQLEKSQSEIETAISQDFIKIQKLMNSGLINSVQGQNLKKQVLKKAFDKLVQTEKIKRNLSSASNQTSNIEVNKNKVFEEFSKSNPDFFNPEGRKDVLEYLKSNDVIMGKDELSKISEIIRIVEKSAIERYLKKVSHEKTLRTSNEAAKQRLTANAQKSTLNNNLSRSFTREQIGKMSSAEFTKYEPIIMEQLKKGLIK